MRLEKYRRQLQKLYDEGAMESSMEQQALEELDNLQQERGVLDESHALLQTLAKEVQEHAHREISQIVSRCLKAVFPDPYEFEIRFTKTKNRTDARIVFVRDGTEIDDPLEQLGGGVVDVASFALRLSCLLLSQPKRRRLMVLDEPFKFISKGLRPRAAQLLVSLAEELEVQFIVVTHIGDFELGNVVELGEENGQG